MGQFFEASSRENETSQRFFMPFSAMHDLHERKIHCMQLWCTVVLRLHFTQNHLLHFSSTGLLKKKSRWLTTMMMSIHMSGRSQPGEYRCNNVMFGKATLCWKKELRASLCLCGLL